MDSKIKIAATSFMSVSGTGYHCQLDPDREMENLGPKHCVFPGTFLDAPVLFSPGKCFLFPASSMQGSKAGGGPALVLQLHDKPREKEWQHHSHCSKVY